MQSDRPVLCGPASCRTADECWHAQQLVGEKKLGAVATSDPFKAKNAKTAGGEGKKKIGGTNKLLQKKNRSAERGPPLPASLPVRSFIILTSARGLRQIQPHEYILQVQNLQAKSPPVALSVLPELRLQNW